MDNLIDCRGIGLTLTDEIGDTGFHDFALIVYHIMAYQSAQLGMNVRIFPHFYLGLVIGIEHRDTTFFQQAADITLTTANAARNGQ